MLQERAIIQHISDKEITIIKIHNLTSTTKKGNGRISTCLHIPSTPYSMKACTTRHAWMPSLSKCILGCWETSEQHPQGDAPCPLIKALKSSPLLFNPLSVLVSICMQFSFSREKKTWPKSQENN